MSDGSMDGGELVLDPGEAGMESSDGMESAGAQSDALPDFSDETLDESMESFEEAMESAAADAAENAQAGGFPGGGDENSGEQGQAGGGSDAGRGQPPGSGGQSGSGQPPVASGTGGGGTPPGQGGGSAGGGSRGVLTGAEQVAILDGQLNRGTGEFDELILRERDTIRRTTTNGSGDEQEPAEGYGGGGYGAGQEGGGDFPPMSGSGGGGQGGPGPIARGDYDGDIPQNTAVYPPPADIPSGNDDDVVARQLREAAMREPDPKLREKLWDEYRKYKGIE